MSAHWDKLAVSQPLNRTAGLVASQSRGMMPVGPALGEHHDHWDVPPPIIPAKRDQFDWSGAQKGRLKVIGYLGKLNDKGRWLVRCACGAYEARRAKSLSNAANTHDMCAVCAKVEQTKRATSSMTHRRDGTLVHQRRRPPVSA